MGEIVTALILSFQEGWVAALIVCTPILGGLLCAVGLVMDS